MDDDPEVTHDTLLAISIPEDSLIPDEQGRSSAIEYERYFRISRENLGLLTWTRTCLETLHLQMQDLTTAEMSFEDKFNVLQGMVQIYQTTLDRWVHTLEATREDAAE